MIGGYGISSRETGEGNYLSSTPLFGARAQYDHAVNERVFVGGLAAYERVSGGENGSSYPPSAHVALVGATAAIRRGNVVRGGLRLAGGFALGIAADPDRSFFTPGWFFDAEGEIALRNPGGTELFLDVPVFDSRTFYFVSGTPRSGKWWYAVPLIPVLASVGVRVPF